MAKHKEDETPYEHQEYPKVLYRRHDSGAVVTASVRTPEDHEEHVKDGWEESPADLPSPEQQASANDQLAKENEMLRAQLKKFAKKGKSADVTDPPADPDSDPE